LKREITFNREKYKHVEEMNKKELKEYLKSLSSKEK